jgi:O-antigen ligase
MQPYFLYLLERKPLFGYGIGSFGPTAFSLDINHVKDGLDYMDSTYRAIILQFGIVGALIYVLVYLFTTTITIIKSNTKNYKNEFATVILFNIIFYFHSLFFNTLDGFPGSILFFAVNAFFIGCITRKHSIYRMIKK